MKTVRSRPREARHPARRHRGVVMLVTLLAMVIMLVGAVALLRSFTASMNVTGNAAIKRDLANQAERAMAVAVQLLDAGALSAPAAREASDTAANYSAAMLATNAQGIPLALLNDATFTTVGVATNDIVVTEQGVRVRWVLDRLCTGGGSQVVLGTAGCTVGPTPDARGGSASDPIVATQQPQVLYRVSIRVDGPRRTQAFFQSTLAL